MVTEFVAEGGLHPTVLVGHSMGGAITQSLALAYPDQLMSIVLVGTGVKLRVHPKIFAGLRDDPRGAIDLIARGARAPGAPGEGVEQDTEALLRTPVPVIEGDLHACDVFDLMTPLKYAEYLHQRIQGSQLVLVPAAGHIVMLEKPDGVNQTIEAFLNGLGC